MTLDELKRFRQLGSRTAGHPERGLATGIETTTGPLGQGLANSVGMALAERHLAARVRRRARRPPHLRDLRRRLPDGRDQPRGDLARRPSEAQQADRAVGRQLDHDRRRDRASSVSDDQLERFRAHGWAAERIDGLDHDDVAAAIDRAQTQRPAEPDRLPARIIAFGAPTKAGTAGGAWQPARRRGDQGRQGAARLGIRPVRRPRRSSAPNGGRPARAARRCGRHGKQRLAAAARRPGAPSSSAACKGELPARTSTR